MAALGALVVAACGTTSESDASDPSSALPGVTDSTVTLGIAYPPDTSAEAGAVGQNAPSSPAFEDAAAALADEVNADGGLLGRDVELVFHPYDLSGTFSAAFQGACAQLTEDNEVFAATTELVRDDVSLLAQCLSEQGSLLVFDQVGAPFSQETFEPWAPYVYNPAYVYFDRYGSLVEVAADAEQFGEGARFGVVHQDLPALTAAVDDAIAPAVESAGGEVVAEATLSVVTSAEAFGQTSEEMANAVLQFKSEDVDQVMFVGGSAAGPLVFMNAAEAQGYQPSYLLTSDLNPQYLMANAPEAQLANVSGVGWLPAIDVGAGDAGEMAPAAACFDVLRAAGIDVATDPNQLLHLCGFFDFLQALTAEAGELEADALSAAYADLGGVYESTSTFAVAPRDGRTDGVAEVRTLAYATDCSCFRYTSDPLPLP